MKQRLALIIFVLALVGLGVWFYRKVESGKPLPEGLLQVNGRLEADHILVSTKFAGRVKELRAEEGDWVQGARILAVLDDTQLREKVRQAEARQQQMEAKTSQAQAQLAQVGARREQGEATVRQIEAALQVLRAQERAAQVELGRLCKEVPLSIKTARSNVEHGKAELEKAQARADQAELDAKRYRRLLESGAVEHRLAEQMELAKSVADSDLASAKQALTRAKNQERLAGLGFDEIASAEANLQSLRAQILQTRQEKARAESGLKETDESANQVRSAETETKAAQREAEAALSEARTVVRDLEISSPLDGVVVSKLVQPGEVVAAGTPLYDLVNLDELYLKVYVPESEIGKVRLGSEAQIYCDTFPDRPFPATVKYISSRANFTPKEVQTKDERVKLVYPVKLYLDENPDRSLTPGLPADAIIRWKEEVPWQAPHW